MSESVDEIIETPQSRLAASYSEWLGDWGGKLTAAFVLFLIFHILYVLLQLGADLDQSLTSNIISLAIYAGPCITAWRAATHPMLSKRGSIAWWLVSLANLTYFLGTALWIYYENYLGEQPYPSWADAGYLAFYPLMLAGMLSMVERFRSDEERLNFWLDSSTIVLGGAMVIWYFLIRPMTASHEGDTLTLVLTIGYPVADLVLLLGIASLLLRRSAFTNHWPVNFLLIGCIVNFVADFVFSYQSLHGTYHSGSATDALFTLACFPVMLGGHAQWVISSREHFVDQPAAENSRFFWLPYLAIAVVYGILVAVVFELPESILDVVMGVAGLVTVLVILRQFMFVRENTKANLALSELQERIQGIYSASTDAIGLADFNGTLTEVNESFIRLTGYSRDAIIGTMRYQDFVPDDSFEVSHPPERVSGVNASLEYERDLIRRDGTKRSVQTTLYTVNDGLGKPAAMAVVIRDITDRRALEEQLTHQAMHDSLTGLANRALLQERVSAALNRAKRKQTGVAVLFLDLDNFKTVNDTLGHAAGDSLLMTVADRLRGCLRLSDTPARLGGDEFAVLLEDTENNSEEIGIAERLLEMIRRPIEIDGKEVFVGASIGIAIGSPADRPDDVLRNADVAMYTAKRNGKNCYAVFQDSMHEAVIKRAQLEDELRTALERDEFHIRYQPIVELGTGRIAGLEALLRWSHPRGLDIGPSEFIPIAEEANLISEIGKKVLDDACAQIGKWNREIMSSGPLSISVNISSRQFQDEGFTDVLRQACTGAGLPSSHLILEITESTMLINADTTIRKLEEIRRLGVKLAVDDFGTGYSSLSYLHKFPVDVLKIDQSFVEKINESQEGAAMTRAIISMSETLRLTTIAEGIENAEQMDLLYAMGCNWGQGYHFARPLDAAEMERFLIEHQRPPQDGSDLTIHLGLPALPAFS